jgi:hypothetical protein
MPSLFDRADLPRLLRAWLLTALSDGLFAIILTVVIYHSTVSRLWQGVAGVLLGPETFNGGTRTALIGVAMHFGVALGWSTVFLALYKRSAWIQRVVAGPYGTLKVASVYGPCIWLVMSLAVIPLLVHRAPHLTVRWCIQWIGHAPFVGLPIVAMIGGGRGNRPAATDQGRGGV